MSIQKIPLASLEKIRAYLTKVLVIPESENHPHSLLVGESDDLPEPESVDELSGLFNLGGDEEDEARVDRVASRPWFVSAVNPATPLRKLPGLRLKSGLRLVSYAYRPEADPDSGGIGVTWAVPEEYCTMAELEEVLVECEEMSHPPHPHGALEHFMMAVDGDRTPPSFMIASLFRREIEEFLNQEDQREWKHHRLIDSPPTQVKWQWKSQIKDWSPKVRILSDRQVAVEFFTCRTTSPVAIFRHREQYPPSSYHPKSIDQPIAIPFRR